jgi:hypothetical protein
MGTSVEQVLTSVPSMSKRDLADGLVDSLAALHPEVLTGNWPL